MFSNRPSKNSGSFILSVGAAFLVSLCAVVLMPGLFDGDSAQAIAAEKACAKTALAAFKACACEVNDDYWIAVGNCNNLSDGEARAECLAEARSERNGAREDCRDQMGARLEICEELGQAPYDPLIVPDDFVDFQAVLDGTEVFTPNTYFPLEPGTVWNYETRDANDNLVEKIEVEVLEETKEILGVNCIVVRDRVWEIDGVEEALIEDTDDWYAQKKSDGTVWYFGESVKDYEDGELVSLDGSWKGGRDDARPGILMLADPQEDNIYRQEFALGDAEDMAKVGNRGEEAVTVPYGNYVDDVLKTTDWTPMEPDVFEFKYYAPGVGLVLEVNPDTGERVELVGMTP